MPIQKRSMGDCLIEVRIKQVVPLDERQKNPSIPLNVPRKEITYRSGGINLVFREKIPKEHAQAIFNSFKRHFNQNFSNQAKEGFEWLNC